MTYYFDFGGNPEVGRRVANFTSALLMRVMRLRMKK